MTARLGLTVGTALVAAMLAVPRAPSLAQEVFPNKPIRVVVPFPAGGTTDMLARVFGQKMQVAFGQPVIVENMGGAGGSVGAENVARAAPDGYTLLFHNLTFSTTTASLQYAGRAKHDLDSFAPVSLAANVPMLVMANPQVAAKDLKEFVALAKSAKDGMFYGSTGPGSTMNLVVEVLKRDAGIKLDHVPFRGAAPLVQELVAGRIHLGGDQLSTSIEFVRAGSLKPMATLAASRIPLLPDVPTVRELDFPNMEMTGWNGYFAPAKTPDAIVAKLQGAIKAAAGEPETKKKMADFGAQTVGSTPAELGTVVREQIAKVRPFVEELKLIVQ
jgi:tripartite-type tricarboxylate transporter receptor subunit TctC